MRDVVCVIHVQTWERLFAIDARHVREVDAQTLGTGWPVELAFAAEHTCGRRERVEEVGLELRLGGTNESVPVGVSEPLAHAALEPDARLDLCEQGAPVLRGALATDLLHRKACRADVLRPAATEAEQWQRFGPLHGLGDEFDAVLLAFGRLLAFRPLAFRRPFHLKMTEIVWQTNVLQGAPAACDSSSLRTALTPAALQVRDGHRRPSPL